MTRFEPKPKWKRGKTYNEEAGAQEDGFHFHIQIQRELDAKVVRVGEDFLQEAAPLLANAPDWLTAIFSRQLHTQNTKVTILQEIFVLKGGIKKNLNCTKIIWIIFGLRIVFYCFC